MFLNNNGPVKTKEHLTIDFIIYFNLKLLIRVSYVLASAMNIREYSSVVRRVVPKMPFEPFFTDDTSSSRNRRSSGSIQDILPPGAPGAPTGGNLGEFGTECQVNSCNEWLHMAHLNYNKIESCVIFHNDLKCLQKIENNCRYNMYYMGHKTWADNVFQQRNCSEVSVYYVQLLSKFDFLLCKVCSDFWLD